MLRTVFNRFRATTHYTELPNDYEDKKGLPFRKEDLNQREVDAIFPSHLPAPSANKLLRIIHGRRVAGSLDDPALQGNTSRFSTEEKMAALEYLRTHIPVDEVVNAGLRAEDELKALEEQGQLGEDGWEEIVVPEENAPSETERDHDDQDPQVPDNSGRLPLRRRETDSPYGVSNFDRIRAENIAKQEAEEKRLEAERIKREEEEAAQGNSGTLQMTQEQPRQISPYRQKYAELASSNLEAPPEMKAWERLLPALAMAVLLCGACAALAVYYKPPRLAQRFLPDVPPAAATCAALIALNLAVWACWKVPPFWVGLNRYFIVVAATPRPLQLLGAVFSHQSAGHLAANMVALWFFGTRLHDELGRGAFLALYLSGGVLGFLASLADLVLRRARGLRYTTLGASGAVYGLAAAFFWRHRFEEFKVLGYPPDPMQGPQGLAFLALLIIHHAVGFTKRGHAIDMASHFGGMAAGIAGVELIQRHRDGLVRARQQRLQSAGGGGLDKVVVEKKGAGEGRSPSSS
ncbi:hypothetical protein SLS62_005207 [Diatrype stigma]|uniref:Peptidase S54 rhomboid domain-containing protein n=1 Tax=Diatrype stigma TaxID=117547 RepID=A0AAN9UQ29_9PEZI